MTVPFAQVHLSIGANSVSLPAPMPAYDGQRPRTQALGRTADGTVYVYDKAVTVRTARLRFNLTQAQRDAFLAWFDGHAVGALNTFTYVDHLGTNHAGCRLVNDPAWRKTAAARYEMELEIESADDLA